MKRKVELLQKTGIRIKHCLFPLLLLLGFAGWSQQIDIGIFQSATPNKVEIKLRPDFQINADQTLSGILFTIRWDDVTQPPSIAYDFIFPYFVQAQNFEVHNGYFYQVFAATPFNPVGTTILPGEEILISSFTWSGDACALFELIEDDWTYINNGDFYVDVNGTEVTGIIYESTVSFGSLGGSVTGGGSINLGDPTGTLTLQDHQGTINTWQRNFNNSGWTDIASTSGLTTYSETPDAVGLYEYRCEVQSGSCPLEYSEAAQVVVLGTAPSEWTGNTDSDWFKDGNWTAGVPYGLNARIPDVDPNPFPLIQGDAYTNGLEIQSGAFVTVDPQSTLTLYGDFFNAGEFRVKSSELGTGSFIDNGTITGTGTSKIERYLVEEMWHYISSPISDGLSGIFFDLYLLSWDEVSGDWTYIVPVDIPLNVMEGYASWPSIALTGTTTVVYEGTLNTGPYSKDLTFTAGADHNNRGYNFVGNPYPSAVNWNTDAGWTKTDIDNAIYLYNSVQEQYGVYVYGDATGTNLVNNIIPPGQGFFVHVSNGNATGQLEINNNAREHNDKPFFKNGNPKDNKARLKLKASTEEVSFQDETIIQFYEDATPLFDPLYDGYKMYGAWDAPQMFTMSEDTNELSVNTWSALDSETTVQLGMQSGLPGIYTIEAIETENFPEGTEIILEDVKENLLIDLFQSQEYTFFSDTSDDPLRFNVHFYLENVGIGNPWADPLVRIYGAKDQVCLIGQSATVLEGELVLFDLLGKEVLRYPVRSQSHASIPVPHNGMFVAMYYSSETGKVFKNKIVIR